jgi:hydrogenase-4 membrane subunit HyfE
VNPVVIAFVGVLLVPLFVASWRISVYGLVAQAWLIAWMSYQLDPELSTVGSWLGLFDLVIVRGLAAPVALYAVLRVQRASPRNDVIPPNLMAWTFAVALAVVAFRFADLVEPAENDAHYLVGGAAAALLLGLLVLATQTGPFSQMVGALRIENAIALFELGGHAESIAMRVAQIVLAILTILLFRWYLATLPRSGDVKLSAVEGS